MYLRGGTGVGAFTVVFGGNQYKGTRVPHFHKSAKGIIRSCLKQLESAEILAKKDGKKCVLRLKRAALLGLTLCYARVCDRGRFITAKGMRELDVVAGQVVAGKAAKKAEKVEKADK